MAQYLEASADWTMVRLSRGAFGWRNLSDFGSDWGADLAEGQLGILLDQDTIRAPWEGYPTLSFIKVLLPEHGLLWILASAAEEV